MLSEQETVYRTANADDLKWSTGLMKISSILIGFGTLFYSSVFVIFLINLFVTINSGIFTFLHSTSMYFVSFGIGFGAIILLIGLHKLSQEITIKSKALLIISLILLLVKFFFDIIFNIANYVVIAFFEISSSNAIVIGLLANIDLLLTLILLSTSIILISFAFIDIRQNMGVDLSTMISPFILPVFIVLQVIFLILQLVLNYTGIALELAYYISNILLGLTGIVFAIEFFINLDKLSKSGKQLN